MWLDWSEEENPSRLFHTLNKPLPDWIQGLNGKSHLL